MQLGTYLFLLMSQARIRDTALYIANLAQFRYKERTRQQCAHMLARLKPNVKTSVRRYLKSPDHELSTPLIETPSEEIECYEPESGVNTVDLSSRYLTPMDHENYHHLSTPQYSSEPESGVNTYVQACTANEFVNVPRQFVKPRSVQYHAGEVDQEMSLIIHRVFNTYPEGCSESLYQKAVLREAYLSGLPVMVERDVFTNYGTGSLLLGRVDMEVAGVCLYEFKVGTPKFAEHSKQLQKYIRAYDHNKENIQVAKLVYFTMSGVVTKVLRDLWRVPP